MTVSYKLARKLREAGFKQGPYQKVLDEAQEHPERAGVYAQTYGVKNLDEIAYRPTLEELIEACGDKFLALRRDKRADNRKTFYWAETDYGMTFKGVASSTPEEAVANLWLVLNKNKT